MAASVEFHGPGGVDLNGKVIGGNVPGRERFIQWAKEKFVKDLFAGDYTGYIVLRRYKAQEQISRLQEAEFGLTLEQISSAKGDMRRMAMELLYRAMGMTGLEIGVLFGISPGAVGRKWFVKVEEPGQGQWLIMGHGWQEWKKPRCLSAGPGQDPFL